MSQFHGNKSKGIGCNNFYISFYLAPKTPAFAEQRARLERARMGDLLKAKIQQRPARQELIRQHILEGTHINPNYALHPKRWVKNIEGLLSY